MYLGYRVPEDKKKPKNDDNFVYFRNKYGIDVTKFDEKVVKSRFTKDEFANFVGPINRIAREKLEHLICVYICFFIFYLVVFAVAFLIVYFQAGIQGGIAFFVMGFMVVIAAAGYFLHDCHMRITRDTSRYEVYIHFENLNKFHARGLHWEVAKDCRYLELNLKYHDVPTFPNQNKRSQLSLNGVPLPVNFNKELQLEMEASGQRSSEGSYTDSNGSASNSDQEEVPQDSPIEMQEEGSRESALRQVSKEETV